MNTEDITGEINENLNFLLSECDDYNQYKHGVEYSPLVRSTVLDYNL